MQFRLSLIFYVVLIASVATVTGARDPARCKGFL